jgi:hypothetical protein
LYKVLQELLHLLVVRHHKVKVVKLGCLGPFHKREQNCKKDVEVFYQQDLPAHVAKMLIEMLPILFWHLHVLSQLEQFGHD